MACTGGLKYTGGLWYAQEICHSGFENIVDFNITSNAAEKLAKPMFQALKISSSITSL